MVKSIFSDIFHVIYGAVFSCISRDDCENMCTLSYYRHHCLGLCLVCAVCLCSYSILLQAKVLQFLEVSPGYFAITKIIRKFHYHKYNLRYQSRYDLKYYLSDRNIIKINYLINSLEYVSLSSVCQQYGSW